MTEFSIGFLLPQLFLLSFGLAALAAGLWSLERARRVDVARRHPCVHVHRGPHTRD